MAKIQLLRTLIALLFSFICITGQASAAELELKHLSKNIDEADLKWATQLGETHREEFLERMSSRAKEYFGEEEGMDMLKPRPSLQIYSS